MIRTNGDDVHIRDTPRGPVLLFDDGSPARLSKSEATVLTALMARGTWCSAAELARLVWTTRTPASWRQNISCYVQRLRKTGVTIANMRGRGYRLEASARNG